MTNTRTHPAHGSTQKILVNDTATIIGAEFLNYQAEPMNICIQFPTPRGGYRLNLSRQIDQWRVARIRIFYDD